MGYDRGLSCVGRIFTGSFDQTGVWTQQEVWILQEGKLISEEPSIKNILTICLSLVKNTVII